MKEYEMPEEKLLFPDNNDAPEYKTRDLKEEQDRQKRIEMQDLGFEVTDYCESHYYEEDLEPETDLDFKIGEAVWISPLEFTTTNIWVSGVIREYSTLRNDIVYIDLDCELGGEEKCSASISSLRRKQPRHILARR